ncbi:DUF6691 family protein [uncultured Cohaesibacter sp.]|uniref:DUF6691 family protein n=1 Tax=uncultured Cohaesibacter sp. TaxID=1002546 RepID=UPI00292EC1BE|nr:DUF6691 family protein [uncultured Cohaesibacter sp.]
MRYFAAGLIGAIFGLGIIASGMANPAKVLNFFDIAGSFDPSLAFVMAGALTVAIPGYAFIFRKVKKPVYTPTYNVPTNRKIDIRLVVGSSIFGIGWGIGGFCPGASIPALGLVHESSLVFVVALVVGIVLAQLIQKSGIIEQIAKKGSRLLLSRPSENIQDRA